MVDRYPRIIQAQRKTRKPKDGAHVSQDGNVRGTTPYSQFNEQER